MKADLMPEREYRLRVLLDGATVLDIFTDEAALIERYAGTKGVPIDLKSPAHWTLLVEKKEGTR